MTMRINRRSGATLCLALMLAVRVYDPGSGRTLDCLTTESCVLSYTANALDGTYVGGRYRQYGAFTLETQHFPDSLNHPAFPTTELKPG